MPDTTREELISNICKAVNIFPEEIKFDLPNSIGKKEIEALEQLIQSEITKAQEEWIIRFGKVEGGLKSISIVGEKLVREFLDAQKREAQEQLLDELKNNLAIAPDCIDSCNENHWHHVTHNVIEAKRKEIKESKS